MKRLVSLLLILTLAAGLAGCASSPEDSSSGVLASSGGQVVDAGATTAAPATSTTVVTTTTAATTTTLPAVTTASKGGTTGKPVPTLPTRWNTADIQAPAALLYNVTDDRMLFEKGAQDTLYPASTTKLLTALVALKYCPEDTVLTVTQDALNLKAWDASTARLKPGMKLTNRMALEALLLVSGCDAAYVLAENIGRLIAENEALSTKEAVALFCVKMNEEAALLGAEQSHFANPDGYHHEEHYTTAYDLLLISLEALQHPTIREICAMTTSTRTLVSGQKVTWNNNNQLLQQKSLYYYPGVTGLKSGFTSPARPLYGGHADQGRQRIRRHRPQKPEQHPALAGYSPAASRCINPVISCRFGSIWGILSLSGKAGEDRVLYSSRPARTMGKRSHLY